jgi:hypothetical protein
MAGSAQVLFRAKKPWEVEALGWKESCGTARLLSATALNVHTGMAVIRQVLTGIKDNTGGASKIIGMPNASTAAYVSLQAVGSNGYVDIYWKVLGE